MHLLSFWCDENENITQNGSEKVGNEYMRTRSRDALFLFSLCVGDIYFSNVRAVHIFCSVHSK